MSVAGRAFVCVDVFPALWEGSDYPRLPVCTVEEHSAVRKIHPWVGGLGRAEWTVVGTFGPAPLMGSRVTISLADTRPSPVGQSGLRGSGEGYWPAFAPTRL